MKNARIDNDGSGIRWLLLGGRGGAGEGGTDGREDARLRGDVGGVACPIRLNDVGIRDLGVEEAEMESSL